MNPFRVVDVEARDVDVALREPFGIATGAQVVASNVFVRVLLEGGAVGWGEAAPFPAVNGETRAIARAALAAASAPLVGSDARAFRRLPALLAAATRESPSARAAIETAVLDALARALGTSLVTFFGGASTRLTTDLTITTGTCDAAAAAAARIAAAGYSVIKLKVGGASFADDRERVRAVVAAAPACALLLDANGGMAGVDAARALVDCVRAAGSRVALFEQPLPRDDPRGMAEATASLGCAVCADESVASAADVARVAAGREAHVVNVKITKSGLVEALDMIATARATGLGLMIGGMVESSLAMSASACVAAGQGGFAHVDLDTPLWMIDEPVRADMLRDGPALDLAPVALGHGAVPSFAA